MVRGVPPRSTTVFVIGRLARAFDTLAGALETLAQLRREAGGRESRSVPFRATPSSAWAAVFSRMSLRSGPQGRYERLQAIVVLAGHRGRSSKGIGRHCPDWVRNVRQVLRDGIRLEGMAWSPDPETSSHASTAWDAR